MQDPDHARFERRYQDELI